MTPESIISKARGALILSKEGATEGERAAASAALERILAKHDLSLDDLASVELDWYTWGYTTDYEKRMLMQLYSWVTDDRETKYLQGDASIETRLTPDEFEKMGRYYTTYLDAWREAVDVLWTAFVLKHKLYSGQATGEARSIDETIELALMARGLPGVRVPISHKRRIP